MHRLILGLAALATAGCSSAAGTPTAYVPYQSSTQLLSRVGSPDVCHSAVKVVIHRNGGSFNVPPCAGWTGAIAYPSVGAKFFFKVSSSTTNRFGVPPPPEGTAIFYILMRNVTHFRVPYFRGTVSDTITSPRLTSNHTYSLMVYYQAFDDQCSNPPCPPWSANIGSPPPNSNSITFPSPLNGARFGAPPVVWQFVQN
jgi:hypothetical protein